MKHRLLFCAAVAAAGTQAVDARAQAWLADRRYAEGIGVRTGNVEIHPGVGAEFGYDSNYFQRDFDTEPVVPALRLRITPHLSLSTLSAERLSAEGGGQPDVRFRLDAAASYNEFFPITDRGSHELPDQRYFAFNAGGELDIAPQRPFGGDLNASYERTVEPSNNPDTDHAWNRGTVRTGAGIKWRPGGGIFQWRLGYALRATLFEEAPFQGLNNLQHTLEADGRWTFLPRTALLYRGRWTFLTYTHGDTSQNSGELIRSLLGLNGLVTKHFGFLLLGGWGASFYDRGPTPAENFDSFIGQAEITYFASPNTKVTPGEAMPGLSTVSVGYTRDFSNSYFGDYYQIDRVYGNIAYFIGGFLVLGIGGGYSRITRPPAYFDDDRLGGDVVPCGEDTCVPAKGEDRMDASLFAEYRVVKTVGINTTVHYNADLTSTRIPDANDARFIDELRFTRWEVYLGARWFL